jgi:hypothetical protein
MTLIKSGISSSANSAIAANGNDTGYDAAFIRLLHA